MARPQKSSPSAVPRESFYSKEIMARLKVKKGDLLYISETPSGIQLSPYNASLAHKLDTLETVMRENRDVLRKLAK